MYALDVRSFFNRCSVLRGTDNWGYGMKYILIIMAVVSVTGCARREYEQVQYRQSVGREQIYKIIKTDELRRADYENS
jgi:hypothetical protein